MKNKLYELKTMILKDIIRNRQNYNTYINELSLAKIKEVKHILKQL